MFAVPTALAFACACGCALAFALGLAAIGSWTAPSVSAAETASDPTGPAQKLGSERLHNLHRVTPRLLCGSSPEGDAAFAELAALGVKVVVSVDGARPDVEAATRHGLRYIHLPIGYDGLSTQRLVELTQVARGTSNTVYVHCHHGRHRGPAAAAVLAVAEERWNPTRVERWMTQAGTGREYPGLYRSAAAYVPPPASPGGLDGLPEVARTTTLVEGMVAVDGHMESLKASRATRFREVPGHPDIAPAHASTLLWEQLRELGRHEDTLARSAEYRARMAESEKAAGAFREAMTAADASFEVRDAAWTALEKTCAACHRAHRN